MANIRSLSVEDFETTWRPLHDAIFSKGSLQIPGPGPFRKPDWKVIVIPYGINMEEETFRSLAQAAEVCGDDELIIADAETLDPETAAIIIPWSYATLAEARFREGSLIGVMDMHLFGASGEWGAVSACSLDDILFVAGNERFTSRLLPNLGGESEVRRRFLEFASQGGWGMNDEIRKQVLGFVGW